LLRKLQPCGSSTVTDPPIIAEIEPSQGILPLSADFAVKTRFSFVRLLSLCDARQSQE
jgi:hypothetical protein